jgi:cation diffusion facilitator CzcD-associated flavoprotein CzcO
LTGRTPNAAPRIAIVGTGFSGLCMAIQLQKSGLSDFVLLERAGEVGGTWRDNTYPGCACDIPSHLYSFSFELNPDWARTYPAQPEIQAYLVGVARKWGLHERIRFGFEVADARFDEQRAVWTIRSTRGEVETADVLVNGSGPLSRPAIPDVPGLGDFAGRVFHSAQWDHDYALDGKRVAAIGTGASAIQFVPAIAPRVAKLTVFQRTAPWIVPRPDRTFAPWTKRVFARLPWLQRLYRHSIYWRQEVGAIGFVTPRPRLRRLAERFARRHLAAQVPDQTLRAKLTPDYAIGCKRILISDDWYPALGRANVEVVTDPIECVTAHGVVTRDGREHAVDAIVLGTGFRATDFLVPMQVFGPDGRELSAEWRRGAESWLGIAVAGFPNLFLLVGPNTGLGHNSMVFMIEAQVRAVVRSIERMRASGARRVEVRREAQQRFVAELQRKMADTVWLSGCRSWYLSPDGRNWTLWPGFTFDYWWRTRRSHESALLLQRS